jgi:hypothetical protein
VSPCKSLQGGGLCRRQAEVASDLIASFRPRFRVYADLHAIVKDCDVFISHPVRAFVPKNVTSEKVGYLPATTDWLDGLNKHMAPWDEQYYLHEFKTQCYSAGMRQLGTSTKSTPRRPSG